MKRREVIKSWIKWHRKQMITKSAEVLIEQFRVKWEIKTYSMVMARPRPVVRIMSI